MLVSCRWLKDYADYNISEVELADRLTMVGASVETITEIGRGLEPSGHRSGSEAVPHPRKPCVFARWIAAESCEHRLRRT